MLFETRLVPVTVSYTVPTAHKGLPEFAQLRDNGITSWIV